MSQCIYYNKIVTLIEYDVSVKLCLSLVIFYGFYGASS